MHLVYTCGRFNPPTLGHKRLINTVQAEAKLSGGIARVFTTYSHDAERNPLCVDDKIRFLKLAFPDVKIELTNTPFSALEQLIKEGSTEITVVLGEDRHEVARRLKEHALRLDVCFNYKLLDRPQDDYSATLARLA